MLTDTNKRNKIFTSGSNLTQQQVLQMDTKLKLVVVGDGAVGKSCMLIAATTGSFPAEYVPTTFDNYSANKMIDGKPYSIALWDTAGQEDYDRLRPLSYPQTDVFLVCYDISNDSSFSNIEDKWIPEIDHFCPSVPRILVGCKKDLRGTSNPHSRRRTITFEEGKKAAANTRCCLYIETSSLHGEGIDGIFELAARVAVAGAKASAKKKGTKSIFAVTKKTDSGPPEIILPPVMPPAGFAPEVEIETCTIGEQWLNMLQQGGCADTSLVLPSGVEIIAHKTILCSASTVFRKALNIESTKKTSQIDILSKPKEFSHPAIAKIQITDLKKNKIYLTDAVQPEVLKHALEFLYSGVVNLEDSPAGELLDSIRDFSNMFELSYLQQICDNVDNDEEFLNPSIGTYVCDLTGQKIKDLFFNKQQAEPDVQFVFGDKTVYGHKAILSARNKTMAVMFDGRFTEGNDGQTTIIDMTKDSELDSQTFLVMLEYLYTGHAPLDQEDVDIVSVLTLADQYNVTRLINLCELYITKLVDMKCAKNIQKADIDVIGLLNMANMYNAPQLSKWCRHFISSNYTPFSNRAEWPQICSEDLEYVEEHRWPPVDYLNELAEYEKLAEKQRSGSESKPCIVM